MVGEQTLVSVDVNRSELRNRDTHNEDQCCSCCCFPYFLSKKPRKHRSGSVSFNSRGERNCLMSEEMTVDFSSATSSSTTSSRTSSSPQLTSVSSEQEVTTTTNTETAPSAPSQGILLLNSEEQSDMIFRVSPDSSGTNQCWRFPAHSFIIGNASVAFQRMIDEHHPQLIASSDLRPEIFIECKPEIFNMLMSYIYKKEVKITSIAKALDLYNLSKRFELYELTELCLTFLYHNASVHNTLEILVRLREDPWNEEEPFLDWDDNHLNELINKCYNILDENAERVLSSDGFENLEKRMIIEVLSRNTLKISNERLVFESLLRWAEHQCLRQRLELSTENKRLVLGDALYTVRYLLMSPEDFVSGPYISDLLSPDEKAYLFAKLKGASLDLPNHLMDKDLDVRREFVKPIGRVSPVIRSSSTLSAGNPNKSRRDVMSKKKNSASKRILHGLGDFVICVIQLLD